MKNSASILMYLRPMRLVVVRGIGPYETTIPATWTRLFAWLDTHGYNNPVGRGYGLALDNPADVGAAHCRYDAGVALLPTMDAESLGDISVAMLPGGPYACRRVEGNYDSVRTLVAKAHSDMVPFDGLAIDLSRPIVSIYLDNPARIPVNQLRADICMPVVAADELTSLSEAALVD